MGLRWASPQWERVATPAILIAVACPVLFVGLGETGVVNDDEAIYHYAARGMVQTGNWLRLEFAGDQAVYDTFTHAPLFIWIKAALISLLGDSYWTMRAPTVGFALLSLLATARLAAHLATPRAGLVAGLLQLTTYQFVYLHGARTGEMEPAVSLVLTLSAYFFLRALEGRWSFVPHHLCLITLLNLKLGLAVLPPLAALIYFALRRDARQHLVPWLRQGVLLVPLGLVWHAYQSFVLWDQVFPTLGKMLTLASSSSPSTESIGLWGNLGFYSKTVFFGAFPHVLLYPIAVFSLLLGSTPEARARWQVPLCYCLAIVGFFMLVSQHFSWYMIPLYPFLSAFAATWLEGLRRNPPGALTLCYLGAAVAVALWVRMPLFDFNPFATLAGVFAPKVAWSRLGIVGAGIGVPVTAAALAAALVFLGRRRWASLRPRVLAAVLTLGVLCLGTAREIGSLRFTSHVSEAEALQRDLERTAASGMQIRFPIVVPANSSIKLLFLFADDYDLLLAPGPAAKMVLLGRRAGDAKPAAE